MEVSVVLTFSNPWTSTKLVLCGYVGGYILEAISSKLRTSKSQTNVHKRKLTPDPSFMAVLLCRLFFHSLIG